MFIPYYECHVTYLATREEFLATKVDNWKPSIIDGDPILGEGVKCYLTRHYPGAESMNILKTDMEFTARELLSRGLKVLRSKVELVVWDTKAGPI